MPELSEEKLTSRMHQIEQIAEEYNMVDKIEDIVQSLKDKYKEISDEVKLEGRRMPEIRVFNKALGAICTDLGSFGGERFDILILGYNSPKDWDAQERDAILAAWEKGLKPQDNLINSGKIMQMMKQGKMVNVSRIDKWEVTKKGDFIVLAGKELEEGEDPIPRDSRKTVGKAGKDNRNFNRPLRENWSITAYGFVLLNDRNVPFEARIYGNYANPNNEKFLPRLAPAFGIYKSVFSVDEDNSDENKYRFNRINAIEKNTTTPLMSEDLIYAMIEDETILNYKSNKGEWEEDDKTKPFLVDLDDLEDFHSEVCAQRDKDDNIIKSKSGYENTHWNRLGIGIYYLFDKTITKNGNFSLKFRDFTNKRTNGFTDAVTDLIDISDLPREAIISFRTTRKPSRWDAENKVSIQDPINGDIGIGSIMGLHLLKSRIEE